MQISLYLWLRQTNSFRYRSICDDSIRLRKESIFQGRLSHHSSSSISSNAGSINFSSSSTMNDDDLEDLKDLKDLKDRNDHDDVMELKDLRNTLPALSCLMALEKGQVSIYQMNFALNVKD